ncbi:MAG TPA: isocitrate lyase/phosphoenolpyruvate mutase family protein [Candidatus Desulfobacillus sp.]|nr:isocitrate lyase/phosphoenolpyruvate mutase family protein [Candidatus Desulfobacillus sp.]
MPTTAEKRAAFRALHESGCFILPNPWDIGGARYLERLGFKALATTSAGHAWSRGRADGRQSRQAVLAHLTEMAAATALPVNADFESGFAEDADGVAESVRLAVATGIAGLSIEDSTGDPRQPLRGIDEAVARLRAARAAIDACGGDTLLVARAENYFAGQPDLDDVLRRLAAYAEAGADCLYAPGLRTREEIRAVVAAVAPKPVNVLAGPTGLDTLGEFAELGVRRVSLGGALARAAWSGFMKAAQSLASDGRFEGLAGAPGNAELNALFAPSGDEG